MAERPIIFSGPMVCAILDGRKTQTRRLVNHDWWRFCLDPEDPEDRTLALTICPHGVPGDRLWVREAWAASDATVAEREPYDVLYRGRHEKPDYLRWRSPSHMPRWASRLTLEITEVRVERLQAISEADAKSEGVKPYGGHFESLWDSINAKRGHPWASNPWVWVLSFRAV